MEKVPGELQDLENTRGSLSREIRAAETAGSKFFDEMKRLRIKISEAESNIKDFQAAKMSYDKAPVVSLFEVKEIRSLLKENLALLENFQATYESLRDKGKLAVENLNMARAELAAVENRILRWGRVIQFPVAVSQNDDDDE